MSSTPAEVCYHVNKAITVEQFSQLLSETTLGPRRPLDNPECLAGMLEHSDILVTAWAGERLIGIARSVTDSTTAATYPISRYQSRFKRAA